jgi:cyclophilin family peptidyl-prolyl cis-trans isomerase
MRTVGFFSVLLTLLSLFGFGTSHATAQEQPPAKKATKAAGGGDPAVEFKKLFALRQDLGAKLTKLQEEIAAAGKAKDAAGQKALIAKFNGEVQNFQENVLPPLLASATQVYLKDFKNADAESIVLGHLQELYHENRYKDAVAESNPLLEAGCTHPFLLNIAGVSKFATQDFAGASQLLTLAKEAGGAGKDPKADQIFESLGARYLDECKPYAKMWKTEQAIREREAAAMGEERLPRVLMKTTKGPIEIELFENEAPNTVANFVSLVDKKFYDGIAFHRVLPNFMAQGGDPNTLDPNSRNVGGGGPGYHIACECYKPNARMHFQGSLSMAHAGKDTGGSQFFLTHLPTPHLNPDPSKPSGHTVFGRVVKGMAIAMALREGDKIESATMIFKRNHPYAPKTLKDPEAVQGKE